MYKYMYKQFKKAKTNHNDFRFWNTYKMKQYQNSYFLKKL